MNKFFKQLFDPAFLICAIVLAVSAGGMSFAIKRFGVFLQKEPLPIKKSLDLIDEGSLLPYKVLSKGKIQNREVLESLGTEDYIEWTLEDTEVDSKSPARFCSLFITYYEMPDRVPHVPEECYTGGGFQNLGGDSVVFKVGSEEITARYLVFSDTSSNWISDRHFSVTYLIRVSGEYTTDREDARAALYSNLFSKHSYFSKIEWKFFNYRLGVVTYPEKAEVLDASEKLVRTLLPILESDHWPDEYFKNQKSKGS